MERLVSCHMFFMASHGVGTCVGGLQVLKVRQQAVNKKNTRNAVALDSEQVELLVSHSLLIFCNCCLMLVLFVHLCVFVVCVCVSTA